MGSKSFEKAVLKRGKQLKKERKKEPKQCSKHGIASDDLNWKAVEVPDTIGDFEGFYGLEEIDGVDVKVVNGKVHFITSDESKIASKDEKEAKANAIPEGDFEVDEEEEKDKTAVKGKKKNNVKSNISEFERDSDKEDEKNVPLIPGQKQKKKKAEKEEEKEEKLDGDAFSKVKLADLPTDNVKLPEWNEISLSSSILNALFKQKFKKPTDIQKASIPKALEGNDVIGKAMTGSGKTLAYGIPILEKALSDEESQHPAGLVFAPTRELATQVTKHLKAMLKYSALNENTVASLTGGLSIQKQERLLAHHPKVLVATPGRCLELLEKSNDIAVQIASTDVLVFDEADRLVEDGHFDDLEKILELLRNNRPADSDDIPRRWQSLVFSATFSKDLFGKLDKQVKPASKKSKKRKREDAEKGEEGEAEEKEVLALLGKKLRFKSKPVYIDVSPKGMVADKITEALIPCSPMERDLMLYYFLTIYPGNTLVFANSIDSVKRLKPMLNNLRIPTVSVHSSMIQKQRLRSLERFQKNCNEVAKKGQSSVLIASDVAARGLDISNIQHVVHYHLPRTADTYVHRSGRTARAGKEGVSVILCSPQEASGPLRKLRRLMSGKKDEEPEEIKILPVDNRIVSQLRDRLDIAAKLAQSEITGSVVNKEKNWIEKAAEELGVEGWDDIEADDYLRRDKKRKEGKQLDKQEQKVLRAELKELLSVRVGKSRSSYITGGADSMAERLLRSESGNEGDVMGYLQKDALTVLKGTKRRKH